MNDGTDKTNGTVAAEPVVDHEANFLGHPMKLPRGQTFRLACSIPGPSDGTSLMRGMGPLTAMSKQDRRLELVLPPMGNDGWSLTWAWLKSCDGLFLQRPYRPEEAKAAQMARMMGLPVWVDWDDDLLSLPIYNPRLELYPPQHVGPMLAKFCGMANYITVSTREIANRRIAHFSEVAKQQDLPNSVQTRFAAEVAEKIQVLPNACMWPMTGGPRVRRISWRGWGNHDADLLDMLPFIKEIADRPQHSRWKWTMIGEFPWQVMEAIPETNLENDPGADPYLYLQILQQCRPFVHIVPLRDNPFNRCRSNLAWIEATAAGAVVIAPDWPEWHRPGVINYSNGEGFKRALTNVMEQFTLGVPVSKGGKEKSDERDEEHGNVKQSREWIEKNILLKDLNEVRWGILNKMVESNRKAEGK